MTGMKKHSPTFHAWMIVLTALAGAFSFVGLVFGLFMLIVVNRPPPEPPNATCPVCMTSYVIHGADEMTTTQQAAITTRCPFCGNSSSVWEACGIFRAREGAKAAGQLQMAPLPGLPPLPQGDQPPKRGPVSAGPLR